MERKALLAIIQAPGFYHFWAQWDHNDDVQSLYKCRTIHFHKPCFIKMYSMHNYNARALLFATNRHIVDRQSAENLNPYIQEALFIMVVANSSVNPLVYGIFNTKKNHRQRNQSTVSRNTMNESKRRTMIVRTRTSTRGDDIHPPRKQHANNAPEESPTNSDSFSQRHHQNHSLHNSGNHAVSKSPLVSWDFSDYIPHPMPK